MKFTEEKAGKICDLIRKGLSLCAAAAALKLPKTTVCLWYRRGQANDGEPWVQFAMDVDKAKADYCLSALEVIKADEREGGKFFIRQYDRIILQFEAVDAAAAAEEAYQKFKKALGVPTGLSNVFDLVARGIPPADALSNCAVIEHDPDDRLLKNAEMWFELDVLDRARQGCRTSLELLARRFPKRYAGTSLRNTYDVDPPPVSEKDRYHKERIKALMRGEE